MIKIIKNNPLDDFYSGGRGTGPRSRCSKPRARGSVEGGPGRDQEAQEGAQARDQEEEDRPRRVEKREKEAYKQETKR